MRKSNTRKVEIQHLQNALALAQIKITQANKTIAKLQAQSLADADEHAKQLAALRDEMRVRAEVANG